MSPINWARDMARDESNREIIVRELEKYPGPRKMGSNGWLNVVCPFHDDSSPSLGIRVTEPSLGVYNCFSCPAKGHWNTFAEKVGLEKVKDWNKAEDVDSNAVIPEGLDDTLLGNRGMTFKQVIKSFNVPEATLWPEAIDWRSFPGWFMRKLGAHIILDTRADSVGAVLPVKVAGKVRGGVKAAFVKDENNKRALSYITSRGQWVQDYGLFPYVYARQLIRKNDLGFIVLCEGPRDAMRLCLNGIPAVAVLGAKNITKRKIILAMSAGADMIYTMPDNDKGGRAMAQSVKAFCKELKVPFKNIKLPRDRDEDDKIIKMDPGNAPKKIIRQLCKHLHKAHGMPMPDTVR